MTSLKVRGAPAGLFALASLGVAPRAHAVDGVVLISYRVNGVTLDLNVYDFDTTCP